MKKILYIVSVLFLFALSACLEEMHESITEGGEAPSQILNPVVENLPGGARVSYTIPDNNNNLLYVKAVCELKSGDIREVRASYYTDNLLIDGFGDTLEYTVNLYSVGRNNMISEPVKVKINPLEAPIWQAYKSLSIKEDWGGVSFTFKNQSESNIVFEFMMKDSLDNWVSINNFYTERDSAMFSVRGFEPKEYTFGVTVRDRWLNRTDTLVGNYTPWYEEKLDKTLWKKANLPTDYTLGHSGTYFEKIFDEIYSDNGWISKPDIDGSLGGGMPQWFTIDLGVKARFSRLVVFYRRGDYLYKSGCPDEFEIYGSNNPNPDGSIDDSWTLLRECKTVKPSGLPHGQSTQEDDDYAAAGDEFIIDVAESFRFFRWKTLSNQAGSTHLNFVEMSLYGQVVE